MKNVFTKNIRSIKNWAFGTGIIFSLASVQAFSQEITEFPSYAKSSEANHPSGIANDKSGNIWFTELDSSRIGKMTPKGDVTEYETGVVDSAHSNRNPLKVRTIVAGRGDNMWFIVSDEIGRITPQGSVLMFPKSRTPSYVMANLALGPDGNIWFTKLSVEREVGKSAGKIGRITPEGNLAEYSLPDGISPFAISAGRDGSLWFSAFEESISANPKKVRLGQITTNGTISENKITTNTWWSFNTLSVANNGDIILLFPGDALPIREYRHGGELVKMTEDGFSPADDPSVRDLAIADDGSVWVSDSGQDLVGHLMPNGWLDEFHFPSSHQEVWRTGPDGADYDPFFKLGGIAIDQVGNVWVAETKKGLIAKLSQPYSNVAKISDKNPLPASRNKNPISIENLLQNIKEIYVNHSLLLSEFCTTEKLQELFLTESDRLDSSKTRFTKSELDGITHLDWEFTSSLGDTIHIAVVKSNEIINNARVDLKVVDLKASPNFETLVQLIGANWERAYFPAFHSDVTVLYRKKHESIYEKLYVGLPDNGNVKEVSLIETKNKNEYDNY